MMGNIDTEEAGVIPRLCRSILLEAKSSTQVNSSDIENEDDKTRVLDVKIEVAYYEIYNERVYDLISSSPQTPCKVREHPDEGAYVENITLREVKSYTDVHNALEEGKQNRQTAETLMNAQSSRSHAIFTVYITQKIIIPSPVTTKRKSQSDVIVRKSKVCLIDLAGSERLNSTGATGDRLKEATNINRSLFVLGEVIKALSESTPSNEKFVPYRNSILTWVLKDSLGGNSKTTMLATISPIDASYAESMNTLRYVERAKLIANKAVVNDDNSNDPYVKHLQQQVALYKSKLSAALSKIRELEEKFEAHVSSMNVQLDVRHIQKQGSVSRSNSVVSSARNSRNLSGLLDSSALDGNRSNLSLDPADGHNQSIDIVADSPGPASLIRESGRPALSPCSPAEDLRVELLSDDEDEASEILFEEGGRHPLALDLNADDWDSTTDDDILHHFHKDTEAKQLRDALDLATMEYNSLHQQMVQAEDMHRIEVEFLEERLQSVEGELRALQEEDKVGGKRSSGNKTTLVHLEEKVASLNNIVEQLQLRLAAKESEVRELTENHKERVRELTRQCNAALTDSDDCREEMHVLRERHCSEIESMQRQTDELHQQIAHVTEEAATMASGREKQIQELVSIITQQQEEYSSKAIELNATIAEMSRQHENILAENYQKNEEQQKEYKALLENLRDDLTRMQQQHNRDMATEKALLRVVRDESDAAMEDMVRKLSDASSEHSYALSTERAKFKDQKIAYEAAIMKLRDVSVVVTQLAYAQSTEESLKESLDMGGKLLQSASVEADDLSSLQMKLDSFSRSVERFEKTEDEPRTSSRQGGKTAHADEIDENIATAVVEVTERSTQTVSNSAHADNEMAITKGELQALDKDHAELLANSTSRISGLESELISLRLRLETSERRECECKASMQRLQTIQEENERLRLQIESLTARSDNHGKAKRSWFGC